MLFSTVILINLMALSTALAEICFPTSLIGSVIARAGNTNSTCFPGPVGSPILHLDKITRAVAHIGDSLPVPTTLITVVSAAATSSATPSNIETDVTTVKAQRLTYKPACHIFTVDYCKSLGFIYQCDGFGRLLVYGEDETEPECLSQERGGVCFCQPNGA